MGNDGVERGAPKGTAQAPSAGQRWSRRLLVPFASLENRDFRLLWFGQLGQASSMWAEQVARSWLTWQLTGSATALGLVNLFRAVPLIALGMLGGVAADRFDKRKILVAIQLWSLAIYIVMAVLILGGWIRLWHIYLTAFLLGGGMAMNQPVRTSLIPQLLEGRLLVNALSLNSVAINVTRLIGPAAIGFLIAIAGGNVGPAYVVSAVLYTLVLLSTLMIRIPAQAVTERTTSIIGDMAEGFRYMLLENRTVLALVVMAAGPLAFAFSYLTLLPVFVTDVLGMGSSAFGLMQSVAAVGALVGGLTLASRGDIPNKGKVMLATGVTYGAVVMVLGGLHASLLAFGIMVLAGASQTIFRATNNSTLLQISPPQLRGRVVGIMSIDAGIQSLAAVLAGVMTDLWSVSAALVIIGAICVGIVSLTWVSAPSVRRL
ncbi:MAG: MFS transporter [Chloroflexi bacterium]|nr:MFS transporter [Chloroflexota bacterium]